MASNGLIKDVQNDTVVPTFLIKIKAHTGIRYHALLPTLLSSGVHVYQLANAISLLEFDESTCFFRNAFFLQHKEHRNVRYSTLRNLNCTNNSVFL